MGFRRRELNKKVVEGQPADEWNQFGDDPESLRKRKGLPVKDRPLSKYADGILIPLTGIALATIVLTALLCKVFGLHF